MGLKDAIPNKYTYAEYLAFEEQAATKHEYWDGKIIALADGTSDHSKIASSIGTAIDNALDQKGKDCTVFDSDLKIFIPKFNRGVYPDRMVLCEDEQYYQGRKSVITNPSLISEVLSPSTYEYDKGTKFEGYRSLPSFKEYVLVWQTIPKVQSWYKESSDLWRISSVWIG